MNRRKFLATASLCALALAPAPRPAQEPRPAPAPKPSKVFQKARPVGGPSSPDPVAFEFEMNGFSYHIKVNGNGRRTKGAKTRRFNLALDAGGALDRVVYFSEYDGDLLLVCEVGYDDDAGGGFVTLLEQPSMRALWKQPSLSFNVGEPLRDGRHLYVTGVGFVGRLDLGTGEFDWKHDDLYDPRAGGPKRYVSFEAPELRGDAVLFREQSVYNPRRTLVADRKTGKVIRVE